MDEPQKQVTSELLLYYLGLGNVCSERCVQAVSPSEWKRIVEQSIKYNVAPLLYRRIKALSTDTIPTRSVQRLHRNYYQSALNNMRFYQELSKTVKALRSEGISVIVLKGAHLAKVVYDNIALRRMWDLDIMVKKDDLSMTVNILRELGYRPIEPFEIEAICATRHHLPPFIKEGAAPIEIHWTIQAQGNSVDIDGLWDRAEVVIINEVQMLVLSPEDLILHLCLHATQHILNLGLRPFCDLSEIIRRYEGKLDWQQLLLRSRQWGMDKPCYLVLHLLRDLLGEAAPVELLNALELNNFDAGLVAECKAHMIMKINGAGPALTTDLAQFWESSSLSAKLTCGLRKIFLPSSQIAKYYHLQPGSARIYLYYAVRLKYLLWRYGPTMWRLWFHDKKTVTLAEQENSQVALKNWLRSA